MAAEAVPPWKRPRSNFEIVRSVQKVTAAAFAKATARQGGSRHSLVQINPPAKMRIAQVAPLIESVEAVGRVRHLSRTRCREVFEKRFTASRMASGYVD